MADTRVAAMRLRIGKQKNGISIRRQLQGSGHHGLGDGFAWFAKPQAGAAQTQALAIAGATDGPCRRMKHIAIGELIAARQQAHKCRLLQIQLR